jgi:hypothetical protein
MARMIAGLAEQETASMVDIVQVVIDVRWPGTLARLRDRVIDVRWDVQAPMMAGACV